MGIDTGSVSEHGYSVELNDEGSRGQSITMACRGTDRPRVVVGLSVIGEEQGRVSHDWMGSGGWGTTMRH